LSVVLFRVPECSRRRRWSVSTCRTARVLLQGVRLTDDVGWFDERHLCAVLPDTPATGARVFAARACDEIARRQERPVSVVYGYPGTFVSNGEPVEVHATAGVSAGVALHGQAYADRIRPRRNNGNRRRNGHNGSNGHNGNNGHQKHNGGRDDDDDHGSNGHAAATATAVLDGPSDNDRGLSLGAREELVEYFLDGVASSAEKRTLTLNDAGKLSATPDAALEEFFVRPMPAWKRALDLVGATVGLVLLSPVLLLAAAAIKLTSPGPVVFLQKRSGLGGRPFTIYKLRTMCVGAERQQAALRALNEQDGPAFKLTCDPRVTKVGKLLRKTSIDELPQLLNVLKGDMSLVGPRPLPVKEQDGCVQWQRHRLNVTPGLTCIWQVDGRSEVTFDEWVRMDVKYMRRQSLWQDLSILFRTIPSVLLRRGAR
jgi:lipopolysaccharide/colanic/teichoic acid biosynthesis glycosyltransferase